MAIGLGSNLGDRLDNLRRGLESLNALLTDLRIAPLFRSAPVRGAGGPTPTDWPEFLNTAVTGRCTRGPEQLLAELKRIELSAGRRRRERDAPRVLDLDLLIYDDLVIDRPELTLPHPRLSRRLFVLAPLAVIAPDWPVPGSSATVAELLASRRGEDPPVERVAWPSGGG